MKSLHMLFLLLLTITFTVVAQPPQGINYQAVAVNASGVAVVNQLVNVRLSILDISPTGTVVYQETQNPMTDNTGLFSIVIGNGAVVSGVFNTIKWETGAKWLKTEIDITGGTSFILAGNAQFMSVPYAFYATKAKYAGNLEHPDGFSNISPTEIHGNYTVPAGKNLYLSKPKARVDNNLLYVSNFSGSIILYPFIGVSAGSTIIYEGGAFLVDKIVDWKTIDIASTALIVPAGKMFVAVNQVSNLFYGDATTIILLNGTQLDLEARVDPILSNRIFKSGDIISVSGLVTANDHFVINGYFRDN